MHSARGGGANRTHGVWATACRCIQRAAAAREALAKAVVELKPQTKPDAAVDDGLIHIGRVRVCAHPHEIHQREADRAVARGGPPTGEPFAGDALGVLGQIPCLGQCRGQRLVDLAAATGTHRG